MPCSRLQVRWLSGFAIACGMALLLSAPPLSAQAWPTRPVKIVVPHSPGGATDLITRIMAQPLSEALGQPVLVENRPGASGLLGTEQTALAAPDGYTLLMFVDANTIFPSTVKKLSHDPTAFVPITLISRGSHALVAHPSVPANNLAELIAYAKANPEKLAYASPGTGSPQHLAAETLQLQAGFKMTHIPYKGGGQAIGDVVGGQVPLGILGMPPILQHVKAGKLKVIAVTGPTRSPLLPDTPTVAESGLPGFSTIQWQGLVAPAGTPREVIDRVYAETVKVMKQPGVVEKVQAAGLEAVTNASPAEFGQMIKDEIRRWPTVVKAAGVQAE